MFNLVQYNMLLTQLTAHSFIDVSHRSDCTTRKPVLWEKLKQG